MSSNMGKRVTLAISASSGRQGETNNHYVYGCLFSSLLRLTGGFILIPLFFVFAVQGPRRENALGLMVMETRSFDKAKATVLLPTPFSPTNRIQAFVETHDETIKTSEVFYSQRIDAISLIVLQNGDSDARMHLQRYLCMSLGLLISGFLVQAVSHSFF